MSFLPGDFVKVQADCGRILCPVSDLKNFIIETERGQYIKANIEHIKYVFLPCKICQRRAGTSKGKCFICGS
jgi:hypothetical protein